MTRQTSDDELIRWHLAGDGDAFDALARRHSRYAYGLCYRMLGDHHAAEDASQEAFLKAAEALGGFRGQVPFRSWFRRILVNVCLNWRRSMRRHPDPAALLSDPVAGPATPPVELSELQSQVREAIGALPEKQRTALVLRIYEGLSIAEVAALMGTKPENVRTNLFAARQRLRERLAGLFGEE